MQFAFLALAFLLGLTGPVLAAPKSAMSASDGIFAAFRTHALVAIGEWHGLAQEMDFYSALVRDPRFAAQVGNIVLETGSATQQATVDRYVNGENVSYADLRKVWADTVGWFPTMPSMGSVTLYATIRAVNLALPPQQRIKVWLGEPPIDWTQVKTRAEWEPLENQRESHPADLIAREILSQSKKALVIYGAGHLGQYAGYDNLRAQIETKQSGALFIIMPYVGYREKSCTSRFERAARAWPVPALAPIKGPLKSRLLPRGCSIVPLPSNASTDQRKSWEAANRNNAGLTADALLYLGPRARLTLSPIMPDLYLDLDFRSELDRRNRVMTGEPLKGFTAEGNTAAPRPYWPN